MARPEPVYIRKMLVVHQSFDGCSSRSDRIDDEFWSDWKLLWAIGGPDGIKGVAQAPVERICIILTVVEQLGQFLLRQVPPSSIVVGYQTDQVMRTALRFFERN